MCTYMCTCVVFSDDPKVQTNCPKKITLLEGEDFSCWCNTSGVKLVPTANWMKDGRYLGEPSNFHQKLTLGNISKNAAGTYICQAKINTLTVEKTSEIIVECKLS